MNAVVYTEGQDSESDGVVVYKDGQMIFNITGKFDGDSIDGLVENLVGQKPEVLFVKHKMTRGQHDDYPATLEEMKTWKKAD